MIRKLITGSLCLFAALLGYSQEKANPKWQFSSLTQVGALVGSSGINYSAQTIQGLRHNQWFVGLGGGIDHYGLPGFPIFLHGQKFFTQKKNKPYLYAQSGVQIPWYKDNNSSNWSNKTIYDLKTGFLAEGGIGYAIKTGKKSSINFSLGYSYKSARTDEYEWPFFLSIWPVPENLRTLYHNKYQYQRISLKMGFQF